MKLKHTFVILALTVVSTVSVPLSAHHSFSAQYDRAKPTTLKGPVKKVDWINPHARFFVEVTDAAGKAVLWEIELSAPAGLMRQGWTRNSLQIGDVVTVNGSLAKDGSNLANATTVTLANGKRVFAGSSGGDGETTTPPQP